MKLKRVTLAPDSEDWESSITEEGREAVYIGIHPDT